MNITDELRKEHVEILELINAFKKGRGFEASEWRDNLFKAKNLLFSHMAKEDNFLYPEVEKKNPELAAQYAAEMKKISQDAVRFMEKYRENHSGPDFSREYADFVNILTLRIQAEETKLFPVLD